MKTPSVAVIAIALSISSIYMLSRTRIPFASAEPASYSSAGASALEKQIVSKEREGLEALKAGDTAKFGELTAEEAIFVDSEGPASKSLVLKNVAGFKLTEYSMESVEFLPLSANTGFITYKVTEKGISHGKEFEGRAFVSSIWTERGGKWVCLFSQETAAR